LKGKPRGEVIGILRGNFAAAQIAKRLKVIAVSTNKKHRAGAFGRIRTKAVLPCR